MPKADFNPRRPRPVRGRTYVRGKGWYAWLHVRGRKRPGKDDEPGAVPVEPNRPLNLSGGAEAALDFED